MTQWVRPFKLGPLGAPPITQVFGNELAQEPLGWKIQLPGGRVGIVPDSRKGGQVGHWHRGVDYGLQCGWRVRAAFKSLYDEGGFDTYWGANIVRFHNGRFTHTCGHLSEILEQAPKQVVRDEILALSGGAPGVPGSGNSTGCHLHWEVWDNVLGCFIWPGTYLVRRPGEPV